MNERAWNTIHYFVTGTNTWNEQSFILNMWWNVMSDNRYIREELGW